MEKNYQIMEYFVANPFLLLLLMIWILTWKGLALWMSAKRNQKTWFLAMLIINTLGVLEIIYIIYTKNKEKDTLTQDEKQEIN